MSLAELGSNPGDLVLDDVSVPVRVGDGCGPLQLGESPLQAMDGVVCEPLALQLSEGALFPLLGRDGQLAERVERVLDRLGECGRPVGEGRRLADEVVDLFELHQVRPVGDDPVATLVLQLHGGNEVLVQLGRVEV